MERTRLSDTEETHAMVVLFTNHYSLFTKFGG